MGIKIKIIGVIFTILLVLEIITGGFFYYHLRGFIEGKNVVVIYESNKTNFLSHYELKDKLNCNYDCERLFESNKSLGWWGWFNCAGYEGDCNYQGEDMDTEANDK
jgi:hypothetical protein